MKITSISFTDDTLYKKVEEYCEVKGHKSISKGLCELIFSGLSYWEAERFSPVPLVDEVRRLKEMNVFLRAELERLWGITKIPFEDLPEESKRIAMRGKLHMMRCKEIESRFGKEAAEKYHERYRSNPWKGIEEVNIDDIKYFLI